MEHVVFFPAHDGSPAFRRVANLEDAVRLVEHLRNIEGVNEVSCHALTEVPLSFRAYYRVEVPGAVETPAVAEAPVAETPVVEAPSVEAAAVEAPVVETPAVEADHIPPQPEAELATLPDAVAGPQVEAAEHTDEPAMASANGRSNDGAKSLGFFA